MSQRERERQGAIVRDTHRDRQADTHTHTHTHTKTKTHKQTG